MTSIKEVPPNKRLEDGEDEEDYMSEDFIVKCAQIDVKPGLKRTHPTQRDHNQAKKKSLLKAQAQLAQAERKSRADLEADRRSEGLRTRLDTSNKGFAMLQKMGYQSGQSLGKSNSGVIDPIGIQVKSGRGGLGRDAVLREIAEQKATLKRAHLERMARGPAVPSIEEYRAQLSKQRRVNLVEIDLRKSQKACEQLDLAKDILEPAESWFWPKRKPLPSMDDPIESRLETPTDEDEEELCEFDVCEQLDMLTKYLRMQYFYCLWCGTTFENSEDLSGTCAGSTRDDHDEGWATDPWLIVEALETLKRTASTSEWLVDFRLRLKVGAMDLFTLEMRLREDFVESGDDVRIELVDNEGAYSP
eukprot:maker-scaffold134_size322110-snap-gene-2.24 protein:Tk07183 transcript:maker-scaffold134_size322110-snap-gene-2.24-mRNA-1 annotation:"coiled-coil domain-containing protein 75-like isoform x1"